MEFSRELLVDEVLGETFHLYKTKFLLLISPMIVAGILTALLSLIVDWYGPLPSIPSTRLPTGEVLPIDKLVVEVFSFAWVAIGKALLLFMIYWSISTVAQSILVKYSVGFFKEDNAKLGSSFVFAGSKILPLTMIGLLTSLLVYFGLVFLIVPGVLLAIMLTLTVPVLVVENKGVFESMKRSIRLVANMWGKTFGLLFAVYIIVVVVAVPVSFVVGMFVSSVFVPIITSMVVALVQPIIPIAVTLWYFSMIAREQTP